MKKNINCEHIDIKFLPNLTKPKMVISLDGWMDGGDVSTGTVKLMMQQFKAVSFADMPADDFYIQNFPGNMEISSLFRPQVEIIEGMIENCAHFKNTFYVSEDKNLVLFLGREPNLKWEEYVESVFCVCRKLNVEEIYFAGSVAGLTPHTREPKIFCTVSDRNQKDEMKRLGLILANYEGPASIINYMILEAGKNNIKMASLVAEVPAYVQGYNPRCVKTMAKCLGKLLDIHIDLDKLRAVSDEFEKKLNKIIDTEPELAENIRKLEEDYDKNIFNTQMGDLKNWLHSRGIEVD